MSASTLFLEQSWAQALAWTLLHFLWQGSAIGMAMFLLLRSTRLGASGRYVVGVAALVAMLAAPLVTLAVLARTPDSAPPVAMAAAAGVATGAPAAIETAVAPEVLPSGAAADLAAPLLVPVILTVWLAGVVALTVRLLGGWVVARRLARRAVRPVSPEVHALARRVAGRLALDRIVRFLESSRVLVPVTVGWVKPVVLLPASALSGLTPEQIEALVAHELAHVRRHDYLVNLLQSVVETLLFYHPAVWWVSRVVRVEREHCCDDLAVGVCDRLVYVSALSDLAALTATPHLALAATGGSLVGRVRRLLGHQPEDGDVGSSWLPVLFVLLVAAVAVPAVVAQSAGSARQAGPSQGGVVAREVPPETGRAVAGGVSGGQVTGVGQGVATSGVVVAGTSAGVGEGVRAGVTDRVATAGVAGGIVAGASQSTASDQQAEEIRRIELEMARVMKDMQARRTEIEEERVKLEAAKLQAEHDAQRAELEAQLTLARERLEEVKRQVDAGAVSRTQLLEAQAALVNVEQRLEHLASEQKLQQAQLELRLREVREQSDHEQVLRDLEMKLAQARSQMRDQTEAAVAAADAVEAERAALRAAREQIAAAQAAGADQAAKLAAQVEAARQADRAAEERALEDYRQKMAQYERALEVAGGTRGEVTALSGTVVVTDPGETVRESDVLVIEISGETMLPRTYVVQTNGRIRLPLLGELQVRGLTAAQVKDMLTDRLADRQLAEGASVTVTLRRR